MKKPVANLLNLTKREEEILLLLCDGPTNVTIAATLGVSKETVKSELKRIFRKIGVANRVQAAVLYVKSVVLPVVS